MLTLQKNDFEEIFVTSWNQKLLSLCYHQLLFQYPFYNLKLFHPLLLNLSTVLPLSVYCLSHVCCIYKCIYVYIYIYMYIYIYIYIDVYKCRQMDRQRNRQIYRQIDRQRESEEVSNHHEKIATYLNNFFGSCLYQFISFTFYLKPLNKIFFTILTG